MSLFDPHNADPDWQRLFSEAADTPPPRVWEAIERELDDETDALIPVIPFWQRSVFQRVAAAAIVLLTGGLLVVQPAEKKAVVAESRPKLHKVSELSTNRVDNYQKSGQNVDKVGLETTILKESKPDDFDRPDKPNRQRILAGNSPTANQPSAQSRIADKARISKNGVNNKTLPEVTDKSAGRVITAPVLPTLKSAEIALTKSPEIIVPTPMLHQPLQIALLPSPILTTIVQVAAHEPAIATEPQQPTASVKPRGRWLSVSTGQAAFQPSVALRSQPASAVSSAVKGSVSVPDQSVESRAGTAVSVLAVAGFHLSNRWFIEGGAGFQQAQSVVVSPGQVVSAFTAANFSSSSTTLYTDALRGVPQSSQSVGVVRNNYPGSVLADSRGSQTSEQRSTYQFGQATAQLGYQFRPRKRLGIAALGGLIANLFVKNEVENGPVIRVADAVYRPVSVAGLGGLRLRYRASGRWSVSMAGLYQYSLSSITKPGALLSVQPQNVSITGSLDYHF